MLGVYSSSQKGRFSYDSSLAMYDGSVSDATMTVLGYAYKSDETQTTSPVYRFEHDESI